MNKIKNDFGQEFSDIPYCPKELSEISIDKQHWCSIQRSAKERNIRFNITKEDLICLFQKQKGLCALSGIRLQVNNTGNIERTLSLDRIDSNQGYTLSNVQWIHKYINKMKIHYNQDVFIILCCDVVSFNKNKDFVLKNHIFNSYTPKNGITPFYKGELPVAIWKLIVKKAKRRNIGVDVSREEAQELFLQQKGLCALSGKEIQLRPFRNPRGYTKNFIHTASLDRIDSSLPYVKYNIQWVYKKINMMKYNYSIKMFIDMCIRISNKHKPVFYI